MSLEAQKKEFFLLAFCDMVIFSRQCTLRARASDVILNETAVKILMTSYFSSWAIKSVNMFSIFCCELNEAILWKLDQTGILSSVLCHFMAFKELPIFYMLSSVRCPLSPTSSSASTCRLRRYSGRDKFCSSPPVSLCMPNEWSLIRLEPGHQVFYR